MGSGAYRAVRGSRPPRFRLDGPGVPGAFGGGTAGRGQDDQGRAGRGSRLPAPVRAGGGGRAEGERRLHRGGGRGRPRRRPALAGYGVRPGALAGPAGAGLRSAAGDHRTVAGRRVRGGAAVDPRRRAGAPGPETLECPGRARRAAGDRLRRGPGGRADGPHDLARSRRHARLHGAGAGQGHPRGVGGERRVLARRDAAVRGHRAPALLRRLGHGRAGPAGHRGTRPVRPARRAHRAHHRLHAPGAPAAPDLLGDADPARRLHRGPGRPGRRARLPAGRGHGPDRGVPAQPPAGRRRPARGRPR